MSFNTLSIVIPGFNEEAALEALVSRVTGANSCGLGMEVIIVDDHSRDRSWKIAEAIAAKDQRSKIAPRIFEVGIGCSGRTYDEGKKIGWRDGIRVVISILRYKLFR